MTATPEYYEELLEAFPDTESLTVLVVAGASRDRVAAVLGADLTAQVDEYGWTEDEKVAGWALLDVRGGVLAVETSGFGDPTRDALRRVSEDGGSAAVVRNNVLAHLRFGCSRDGELLFDDDEYMYVSDTDGVPDELRRLFDLVWDDLADDDQADDEGADEAEGEGPDPFAVGLAMAELVTGIEVTADHVARVWASGFFRAPSLVYADEQ